MRQPKFRGFCLETNQWHYGHGWFECDYTEEYKKEKGIEGRAILYTEGSPVECELKSMGQFVKEHKCYELEQHIYEGDVLESLFHPKERYHVQWDDYGMFLFVPVFDTDEGALDWYEIDEKYGDSIFVIGNSFENPKLLEGAAH